MGVEMEAVMQVPVKFQDAGKPGEFFWGDFYFTVEDEGRTVKNPSEYGHSFCYTNVEVNVPEDPKDLSTACTLRCGGGNDSSSWGLGLIRRPDAFDVPGVYTEGDNTVTEKGGFLISRYEVWAKGANVEKVRDPWWRSGQVVSVEVAGPDVTLLVDGEKRWTRPLLDEARRPPAGEGLIWAVSMYGDGTPTEWKAC
eukprot:Hpha_TRINITY_DN16843_c1_g1::TRINITY_DN16843_c1_g1_i15::g.152250::m.152250